MANQFVFELGDVAQGFRDADVIVEREYRTAPSIRAISSPIVRRRTGVLMAT
jgi:hypothetical protein